MKAHIEWLTGIIRVGNEFDVYGDDYEFCCTIIKVGKKGYICGAAGTFSKAFYKDIEKVIKEAGIEEVHWERMNNKPRKIVKKKSHRRQK